MLVKIRKLWGAGIASVSTSQCETGVHTSIHTSITFL